MPEEIQKPIYKTAKVEVLDKKMRAFLILKDSDPGQGSPLSIEYLKNILDSAGIKYGIKEDLISAVLDGKIEEDRILIAEGVLPQKGADGYLEYFFPIDNSLKPQLLEDGHIDYREVSIVHSVEKDAPLIRKHSPEIGHSGTDVYGNIVPGISGKEVELSSGQGTYRDSTDNSLIKSVGDGIIQFDRKSNMVEVQRLFVVSGSVDYSTGNIHVKSSVDVKEDVKAGFTIETPYNVEVKGSIENAIINCGGTLKVKGGIKGEGKQYITVGEDLHAGYVANQNIKCGGSIYIINEIRNSTIECENEITIVKNTGVLFGGKITATNKITAQTIGNAYNIATELEVGVVLKYREKYIKKQEERKEITHQIEELKKKITLVAQKEASRARTLQLTSFKEIWTKYTTLLEKTTKEVMEIETAYYNVASPTILAVKTVYPGTIIKIKNKILEVKEELNHVAFRFVDDAIVYSHIK